MHQLCLNLTFSGKKLKKIEKNENFKKTQRNFDPKVIYCSMHQKGHIFIIWAIKGI